MKQVKLVGFLCGIVLLIAFGCSKNDKCDESEWVDVPFETLGNDTIIYTLVDIDEAQLDVLLVIKNQAAFEKHVRCNYEPEIIDFDNNILLAGRTKYHQCAYLGEQRLVLKCTELYYNVEIKEMVCMMPTDVFYFAVVAVDYSKYKVKLNVDKD